MPPNVPPWLSGRWLKVSLTVRSRIYPIQIEIQPNGLYSAQNDPRAPYFKWDKGRAGLESERHLRVSLANDSSELYLYVLGGEVLILTDPEGIVVKYRKLSI